MSLAPMRLDARLLDALDAVLAWIGPAGTQSLRALAVTITPLGSGAVLAVIVAAVATGLALRRRRHDALWLVTSCVTAWVAMHAMKLLIGRPRPDIAGQLVEAFGASFPSGHAMMSTLVVLSLWRLAGPPADPPSTVDAQQDVEARRPGHHRLVRPVLTAAALALVVAVGMSRVLLGVHWPTDVLAGWALGLGWSSLAGRARTRLARRPLAD